MDSIVVCGITVVIRSMIAGAAVVVWAGALSAVEPGSANDELGASSTGSPNPPKARASAKTARRSERTRVMANMPGRKSGNRDEECMVGNQQVSGRRDLKQSSSKNASR